MSDAGLIVPVLLGSVRPERQAVQVGRMLMNALIAGGHEPVLVDPLELRLPLLERTYSEYKEGDAPPGLDRLAALYRRADGFIIVSGEYNHGIPPALKNLLDYFLEEYSGGRRESSATPPVSSVGACSDAASDDARRAGHAQYPDTAGDPARGASA